MRIKALEERLAAVEQRATVRTTLDVSGDLSGLPPDHEEQIYATLQEMLNNALRHALARTVAVTVRAEPGWALFTVGAPGTCSSTMGRQGYATRVMAGGCHSPLATWGPGP